MVRLVIWKMEGRLGQLHGDSCGAMVVILVSRQQLGLELALGKLEAGFTLKRIGCGFFSASNSQDRRLTGSQWSRFTHLQGGCRANSTRVLCVFGFVLGPYSGQKFGPDSFLKQNRDTPDPAVSRTRIHGEATLRTSSSQPWSRDFVSSWNPLGFLCWLLRLIKTNLDIY